MIWIKAHWKALSITLALLLGLAWYSRPVDVYSLGVGELEAVSVHVENNKPGQGVDIVWSTGVTPDNPRWQSVLRELESLRFHRPPGNLIRAHFQSSSIKTQAAPRVNTVIHLIDQNGLYMTLQIGAGNSCYTSPYTSRNLPMSLSGGEEAAQALIRRLQEI